MAEIKLTRTEHGYRYEPLGLRIDRCEGADYDGGPRRTTWDVTAGDDAGYVVGLSMTGVRGLIQHIEDQVAARSPATQEDAPEVNRHGATSEGACRKCQKPKHWHATEGYTRRNRACHEYIATASAPSTDQEASDGR